MAEREPDLVDNISSLAKGQTGFDIGASVLKEQLKTIPPQPGVYRMIDGKGIVLYVGKAKDLTRRVNSYTQRARLPIRLQRMVAQIRSVEIVVTRTEAEALLLEANFIQKHLPPFNILLRDDKSYPYLLITQDHEAPQLLKHRGAKTRKGRYFGPFASGSAVNETLAVLQRGFMLRTCSDAVYANRKRPCLQYHIKRCTAPCVGYVTPETYAAQAQDAVSFLSGKSRSIQDKLSELMQAASDALDYETAARLRDRIRALTSIQSRQDVNVNNLGDADIFALEQSGGQTAIQVFFFRDDRNYGARTFFPKHDIEDSSADILSAFLAQFYENKIPPPLLLLSHEPSDGEILAQALSQRADRKVTLTVPQAGDKVRLIALASRNAKEALARKLANATEQVRILAKLAELFGMEEPPKRIEIYDNSHLSGSHAVGVMVAAGPEGFLRKTYRKFNIRDAQAAGDDFAMMREVMTRRFRRLIEEDPQKQSAMWPDLLLIDGGAGQISKVHEVLNEMGLGDDIKIVGIAKGPDRNAGNERFFMEGREPFSLPHEDPVLYYLQRLRDESHRFAIGTHRAKRTKAIGDSGLEEVPGIGAARKRALLHHFGSAKAAREASVEDLARVQGISPALAQKIHDTFRRGT
ncbi:MAG: excinuclease ABC subunit UvrC [Bdellovibrionales bacterium]